MGRDMGVGSSKGLYDAAARKIRQGFVNRNSPDFIRAIPPVKRKQAA
jgi:hypothetical protein